MANFIKETTLNFKEIKQIGEGGQAIVNLCRDTQLNSIIAVKKAPKRSQAEQHLFFDECKKLHHTRHSNVLPVIYGCQDDDFIYTAMPYLKNGSLSAKIGPTGMDVYSVVRYALQFLAGINHIHTKSLIHFDIKPENVLISDSDQGVISDFGFAKYMKLQGLVGIEGTTIQYVPAETFEEEFHSLKFDIYQCGMTLYHMLIGDLLFASEFIKNSHNAGNYDSDQHYNNLKTGKFPDRAILPNHIPNALSLIIKRATEVDVDKRYDSILTMMNDIAKVTYSHNWIYTTNSSNIWSWGEDSKKVKLELNFDETWNISAATAVNRKLEYCKNNLNNSEKKTLLHKVLHRNWS